MNISLQPDIELRKESHREKSGLILTGVRVIWSVPSRAMFVLRDVRASDESDGLTNRREAFWRYGHKYAYAWLRKGRKEGETHVFFTFT